jgi:hypothetical protein
MDAIRYTVSGMKYLSGALNTTFSLSADIVHLLQTKHRRQLDYSKIALISAGRSKELKS